MLFNYASKEIIAKIVYYGPGLCGKTTNIQLLHEKLNPDNRGKLISLATDTDRTLFFDFMPMDLGTVKGFRIRIQLYTVPGQVHYNATRKLVLKGADALVFVADSQVVMRDQNVESLQNLRQNLRENDLNPDTMPLVFQYNKRDLPNIDTVEELERRLNDRSAPWFESVAFTGKGVVETFQGTLRVLLEDLNRKHQFNIDLDKIEMLSRSFGDVVEEPEAVAPPPQPEPVPACEAQAEPEPSFTIDLTEPVATAPEATEAQSEIELVDTPEPMIEIERTVEFAEEAPLESLPLEEAALDVIDAAEECGEPALVTVSETSTPVSGDFSAVVEELRGVREGISGLTAEIRGLTQALERIGEANRSHLSGSLQGIEERVRVVGQQLASQGGQLQKQIQEDQGMALKAILGKIDTMSLSR